jgi:hypothetical protein
VNRRITRRGWGSDRGDGRCALGNKGKQLRIWRKGLKAQGNRGFPLFKTNIFNERRSSETRRGEISRNTPKIKLIEAPADGVIRK